MATSPSKSPLRVIVDTGVLIAGTVWPRWPHEVLQHAFAKDFRLLLSPFTKTEATMKIREKFPQYTEKFITFLQQCPHEEVADPSVDDLIDNQQLSRDVWDVPVALSGIQAKVDCLVSEDKDLTERTGQSTNLHTQLKILLPGTFLREMMGWTSEELEAIRHRNWEDFGR